MDSGSLELNASIWAFLSVVPDSMIGSRPLVSLNRIGDFLLFHEAERKARVTFAAASPLMQV